MSEEKKEKKAEIKDLTGKDVVPEEQEDVKGGYVKIPMPQPKDPKGPYGAAASCGCTTRANKATYADVDT